jgi:hypothetical protein
MVWELDFCVLNKGKNLKLKYLKQGTILCVCVCVCERMESIFRVP